MLPDEGASSLSRDERVNDVVAQAEELRKRGQPFTLVELCRDCPELLDSVRQVLREVHVIDDLLGEDTDDPVNTHASAPAEAPAELPAVPGYEVLGELGRGGMGVVYHARQLKLRRSVALKMILAGAHAGASELARFRREAAAAAHLQHPNIVPIYEVGDQDGQPYLALEYVDGGSLDQKLAGTPLPARTAAHLIQTLARAVSYAHEHGVVHRDLKPANVLLARSDRPEAVPLGAADAAGPYEPKVTDFGLAKRLEGAPGVSAPGGPTRSGVILGTPSYMAPEQTEGRTRQVGPAADVYALGAILYECLTGRPPFKAATELETLLQVRADEPVPPRQLQPRVPRDLETICLKCLGKAPPRRYASAEALAEDLRRFLVGESIEARPVGVGERSWKWVRRHPGAAGLAAAAMAALLAVAGVAVVTAVLSEQGRRAVAKERDETEKEREKVAVERDEKEKQRDRAARARDRTFDALDLMTSAVTGDSLDTQPAITAEQRKFLAEVLPYYQEFAAEQGEDEGTRKRIAAAALRVGLIHYRLGDQEAGVRAVEQARGGYEQLAADFPAVPQYRHGLASSHNNLGNLLRALGQRRAAEPAHRQALALQEKLAADFPAVPVYRRDLARSHNNLGNLLRELGKRPQAEAAHRQALALGGQLAADFPAVPQYRQDLARSHDNLGLLLRELGKRPQAEAAYRQALALGEQLAADFPAVPQYRQGLARSHDNLGVLLRESGQRPQAEAAHRQALALGGQLAADFPAVPQYRQYLATSHDNLGDSLRELGQRPQAEAALRQALALREQLAADFPAVPQYRQGLAHSHNNLGLLLRELGQRPEAEAAYRQALALFEQLAADFPAVPQYRQDLAHSHNNLGVLLRELGKRPEAEAALRQALALREQLAADFPAVPQYRQDLAAIHDNLGVLLHELGQRPQAEAAHRQALALREQLTADFPTVPAYRTGLGGSQVNFGHWLRDSGQATEALVWFDRAIALLKPLVEAETHLAVERQFLRNAHAGRALTLDGLDRPGDAAADWDRAVELSPASQKAGVRAGRARSLVRADQVEQAVAEAADLAKAPKGDASHLVELARVYALAAGKDEPNREGHVQSALQLLRRAVAKGFKDAEQMKKDNDLQLLRDREEFRQLLAELEGK